LRLHTAAGRLKLVQRCCKGSNCPANVKAWALNYYAAKIKRSERSVFVDGKTALFTC